ncbi:hypothetical protein LNAOJCKE_0924 [Methylorubrum aminovorans]|uniref:Uncharacterized protein n=1 Tax=Methylorubrum aminovorans TaxID=269069 RepID=A0ABQ4UAB7_9HYPH|nr:hypothetical protein [Methylorubrum aminovorans]GJE63726.1 hypothetical protein LNAOJCKE_0924 [Methylorubrum aminovorans]GMA73655.1 hypothetical protein GCM10025880_00720 [Methylorubrum aminovorans]GMA79841.1 hypothetical protein GCM10025880_62580 [Methylorubrum aminovorans]
MLGKLTEGSEKRSEGLRMTPVNQASRMLMDLAEPRPVGDTVKAAITRAARAVSAVLRDARQEPMTYGRCEDLWRREARRVDAAEMDAIRAAHERRHRSLREELRQASALADRLERLAAEALPAGDLAASDEISATARQAKRTARALRELAEQRSAGVTR